MFNCICEDYDIHNAFHVVSNRVARKQHKCCECGRPIVPGATYEYVAAKSEGGFWTKKTCKECARIRRDVMACGFLYGSLWSRIHEAQCGREGDEDYFCICPERLSRTATREP